MLLRCLFFIVLFHAQAVLAEESSFSSCLQRLQILADEQSLPDWVVQQVLPNLEYQSDVIRLDRKQPESTQTFDQYFKSRVTEQRITRGRELYAQHRDYLEQLTREYGVPGQYLIAFWGLETNFGSYLGGTPSLDALATLACDERRSSFFTQELMVALGLLAREQLEVTRMKGSWAGAMGHVQFMPSTYARYAVDGDGDGRTDLWTSTRDALASAAHYLQQIGWQRNERWGREVVLPERFDFAQASLDRAQPLNSWRTAGVLRADGNRLPQSDLSTAIILPMGHSGPAFATYQNFQVIMRWNRSLFYAISVGHLADRIKGGGGLREQAFKPIPALNPGLIARMQTLLLEQGYSVGEVDGMMGPATRAALREYQSREGLIADGFPDFTTLAQLGLGSP